MRFHNPPHLAHPLLTCDLGEGHESICARGKTLIPCGETVLAARAEHIEPSEGASNKVQKISSVSEVLREINPAGSVAVCDQICVGE